MWSRAPVLGLRRTAIDAVISQGKQPMQAAARALSSAARLMDESFVNTEGAEIGPTSG